MSKAAWAPERSQSRFLFLSAETFLTTRDRSASAGIQKGGVISLSLSFSLSFSPSLSLLLCLCTATSWAPSMVSIVDDSAGDWAPLVVGGDLSKLWNRLHYIYIYIF